MGNANTRSMTYHQYYESLQNSNPGAIAKLDLNGLDPYQVLGVNHNFTFDELKEAYRRIARMVHPDKGGTDQLFQMVTDCFRVLAAEYKKRISDRPHHELKKDAQEYYERNPSTFRKDSADFLKQFNRAFDDNRMEDDDMGIGYGDRMVASSKTRENIDIPRTLNKFNAEVFHKTFETTTLPTAQEVVVYREPEAMPLARKIQYTELGADKPQDFSSGEGQSRNSLAYTDYMKAHTTSRLVDPRAVKEQRQYANVEQYESARAEVLSRPMTAEERAWREQKQREEDEAEQRRRTRLVERDRKIALHHDRMNQLMLSR